MHAQYKKSKCENKIATHPGKKSKSQTRIPLSSPFKTFISSLVKWKSKMSKFCLRRFSFVLLGIVDTPRSKIHFRRICAGVLFSRLAISFTSGISNKSGTSRLKMVHNQTSFINNQQKIVNRRWNCCSYFLRNLNHSI